MLNTNNTVNYEINVKRKEKKYSWSTVFAWLYLKTIGRILPKKWNKWVENILYYDKATESNEIQTDDLKTTDESAQIDLKPEVAVKESQSEVVNEDEKVQTNKVTFHDIAMQTECVETTDKNSDQAQQIADLQSENGLLEVKIEELRSIIIRLKADLQSKNSSLKKENRELRSIIERLKKDSRELVEVTDKQEKQFLVKLKAKSEMIECQGRELTELRAEFTDKINELLERVVEVRKNSLIKQLQEEQKQVEDQLKADIKKLQGEKENMEEQLKIMQQQLLNNLEQQKLEEKLKDVDKRLEDIDGETQKITRATKLKAQIQSNLKAIRKGDHRSKVKEVVNEHCNIGKNLGKELRDSMLKAKLSPSVRKCIKKLESNKQEGVNKIVDSILHSFNSKNNNNNDSGELLKEIATEKLTEAKMKCFANKIQELQLTSSIRDKFLSTDQGMCNQTQGGVNEYQLTEKAKKEYTPNSSMSHTNTVSVHLLNAQGVA
ncbi:hypothetical protein FQR65_LT17959 [Abscondita terminalis]|nr:hypothetical protein FQR65_LT17959 [Abscondita terminalis]